MNLGPGLHIPFVQAYFLFALLLVVGVRAFGRK